MNWTLTTPQALLLLPLCFGLAWWLWRGRPHSPAVWLLRFAILTLLIVALANPQRLAPERAGEAIIFVVDQSASLGEAGSALLRDWADRAQTSGNTALRTILFGERALLLPPGIAPPL